MSTQFKIVSVILFLFVLFNVKIYASSNHEVGCIIVEAFEAKFLLCKAKD